MSVSSWRSPLLAALVALLATALPGCGSDSGSSVIPTPTETTETFTGTLSPSGTNTMIFYAKAGQVTVTLTSITPDSTLLYGMVVGVYNPYYLVCTPVSTNSSITQGQSLVGLATATTELCVQLVDMRGVIPPTGSESYTITATHF